MDDGYCGNALQVNGKGGLPSSFSASLLPSSLPPFLPPFLPLLSFPPPFLPPSLSSMHLEPQRTHGSCSRGTYSPTCPGLCSFLGHFHPQGACGPVVHRDVGATITPPSCQGPSPYRTLWATPLRTPLALPYAAPNASPQILQVLPGIVKAQATWLRSFRFTRGFQIGFGITRFLRDAWGPWGRGHVIGRWGLMGSSLLTIEQLWVCLIYILG